VAGVAWGRVVFLGTTEPPADGRHVRHDGGRLPVSGVCIRRSRPVGVASAVDFVGCKASQVDGT